jgi:hypothetical protein
MQNALFVGHLRHGEGERRIVVAEQEVDLVAFDELARLHDRSPGIPAGGVLDDELDWTAEYAALGVDGLDRHLTADQFVFPERPDGAGQRIVEADPDRVGGARADDERTRNPQGGCGKPRAKKGAAADTDP